MFMRATDLPRPACARGYTAAQVLVILGSQDRVSDMQGWMGERDLHPLMCEDGTTDSGPHGSVIPHAALSRFLETRPR